MYDCLSHDVPLVTFCLYTASLHLRHQVIRLTGYAKPYIAISLWFSINAARLNSEVKKQELIFRICLA